MLQKLDGPLDEIARLPGCRTLAAARDKLEQLRQASEAARAAFGAHCARLRAADRWVRNDPAAHAAETEALKGDAAARLAHNEAEAAKRANGETLGRFIAKHEGACLEMLVEELRAAHETARRLSRVIEDAERDGYVPSFRMRKVTRALGLTTQALGLFK